MKKLSVANGTYEKDGQTKTRWVNIGIIDTSQNGKEYCLLDPTINLAGFQREPGKGMLMCSVFDDSQSQQQAPQQQQGGYAGQGQQQAPQQQQGGYAGQGQQQAPQQQQGQREVYYDANGVEIPV